MNHIIATMNGVWVTFSVEKAYGKSKPTATLSHLSSKYTTT